MSTTDHADDAGSLGELLLDIAPRIMRLEAMYLSRLDAPLTHRQYRILQRVDQGVTSPTQISRAAHISLAAISESVDALARRDLVTRSSDENDRRASRLGLTDAGRAAYHAARHALAELEAGLGHDVSPRSLATAKRVLAATFTDIGDSLSRAESAVGRRGA